MGAGRPVARGDVRFNVLFGYSGGAALATVGIVVRVVVAACVLVCRPTLYGILYLFLYRPCPYGLAVTRYRP